MRRLPTSTLLALLLGGSAVSATATGPVVFGGDIGGRYRARPSFIHITSDQNINRIRWSSWGGRSARGRGTMVFSKSDRTPSARIRLTLSAIHRCGNRKQYLHLRVTYTSRKPARERRSYTIRYTCRSPF